MVSCARHIAPAGGRDHEEEVGPLYTLGHSTRSLAELVRICEAHHVDGIADVRRFPGSRRSPHFAREDAFAAYAEHMRTPEFRAGLG
jgi:hypothetical protein